MNQPQLRDIHLPDASLWWPPAPGWWIGLLLILLLALLLPWLRRWWRQRPLRRLALGELARIRKIYKQGQSDKAVVDELARLLRRITISYYGREQQAASTGAEWQAELQRLAPGGGFSREQLELLTHGRYRADFGADVDALLQSSERWMRALPRSKDHVSA
jgi:hypothetical protein